MKTHTGDKTYQCTICYKSFTCMSYLKSHIITHSGEKPYPCSKCDKSYSASIDLQNHMKTHTEEKLYQCSQCDKFFTSNNNLKLHITKHTAEKPYQCSLCDKLYSQNSDLQNHIKTTHAREKPFKCDQCDKCFSVNTVLLHHQKTNHGVKPHNCRQCAKAFAQIKMCHNSKDQFICDIGLLDNQYHSQTGISKGQSLSNLSGDNLCYINHGDKQHNCRQCEKAFAQINMCHNSDYRFMHDISVSENHFPSETEFFNGIKFTNNAGDNLCYINATINGLLNCRTAMHLINSDAEGDVINTIKYCVNIRNNIHCRNMVISRGNIQFENNVQSDPDEFIRCLFDLSQPLKNLFQFNVNTSFVCSICSDITYQDAVNCLGLQECMNGISISSIIQNNRVSDVDSHCNRCDVNTKKCKRELFSSLPKILMVQLKRFETHVINGTVHIKKKQ